MTRINQEQESSVLLPAETVVELAQKMADRLDADRDAELERNIAAVLRNRNWWRQLLNHFGFQFRLHTVDDLTGADANLSSEEEFKLHLHCFSFGRQYQQVVEVLDMAKHSGAEQIRISRSDYRAIAGKEPRTHG